MYHTHTQRTHNLTNNKFYFTNVYSSDKNQNQKPYQFEFFRKTLRSQMLIVTIAGRKAIVYVTKYLPTKCSHPLERFRLVTAAPREPHHGGGWEGKSHMCHLFPMSSVNLPQSVQWESGGFPPGLCSHPNVYFLKEF